MDISAILYAALGGGIGGGLGALLPKLFGKFGKSTLLSKILMPVLVIIGLTVTTTLYKNMTLPRLLPNELASLDREIPVLKFIREENPKIYNELVAPLDKMARNNQITPEGTNEFRANYQKILGEKRLTASAQLLRLENELAADQFKILKEKRPVVCTQKFYARPYDILDKVLGKEYQDKENAILAKYFTETPRDSAYTPDKTRGEAIFNEMIPKLIKTFEITDLDPAITDDLENKADHQKICDLSIAIGKEVNLFSDDELFDVYAFLQGL